MKPDVQALMNSCHICAQCKDPRTRPAGLLHPLAVPSHPWSHLSLDFITGLPPTRGNTVILVVVDKFSKTGHFVALPNMPSAKETAKLLLTQVVRTRGLPSDIVSDRGPQFTSRFCGAFCRLLGAVASLSSGFHPQSNGQTERVNQDLERTLQCLASSCPSSWSEHQSWVEFTHNTLWHSSLGMSPFQCQYSYAPLMFANQEADIAPTYQLGQQVWLLAKDLPLHGYTRKLAPRYIGPFKVLRHINPVSYRLALPPSLPVHPTFHMSRLRPMLCSVGPSDPLGPHMVDRAPAYMVKRLLDVQQVHGGVQYLLDWEGYGPEEWSCIPSHHILDSDLIRAF
ncbi:hypothetical protein P4O66_004899, partial [Electrophorus voltai]